MLKVSPLQGAGKKACSELKKLSHVSIIDYSTQGLEQYNPTSIPEEARPTPPPPIVEGAELVSDDSEDDIAVQRAAEAAGGNLLHNYLLTTNKPPLPEPGSVGFY